MPDRSSFFVNPGVPAGKAKTSFGQTATQNPHPEHVSSISRDGWAIRIESVGHADRHMSHSAPQKRTFEQRSGCMVGFEDWRSSNFMLSPSLSSNLGEKFLGREYRASKIISRNFYESHHMEQRSFMFFRCGDDPAQTSGPPLLGWSIIL